MAGPSAIFTELVSTTLRYTAKEVVDNISGKNALLSHLREHGNIKTIDGGTEIQLPLEYAENATIARYSGLDPLNIGESDVISSAKFDWMQIALSVVASGREMRINNGEAAMINLAKAKAKNAVHTANNFLSVDLYSDGSILNQINGLAALVTTNGQGTIGGFDAAVEAWWRNQFSEISGTNTWTKATIKGEMNKLWYKLVFGDDKPDLLVSTQDFYGAYEESLQDNQRYMDAKKAAAGFESLRYKSASIIFDSNANFGEAAEKMYFLNTKYLYLVQHEEAQFTEDDPRKPTNQDGVVVPMYWMGNACCSNRSRQGVLIDAA